MAFSSCTKDEVETPQSENRTLNQKSLLNPSNSNNPYDNAGLEHNKALKDFVDNYLLTSKNLTDDSVFTYFADMASAKVDSTIENYRNYANSSPATYPNELSSQYQIDKETFEYYFDIRDIANDGSLNLSEKITAIRSLENNYDFSITSETDKEVMLKESSVARYSLYLWAPESESGLGYFHKVTNAKDIDWAEVGRDDIWGLEIGALFGENPASAVGGAVVGSAVSALRQATGG